MDISGTLVFHAQGHLKYGKGAALNKAMKLLEKTELSFFPKELIPQNKKPFEQSLSWEGQGTWQDWVSLVQGLQALASEAIEGDIRVELPTIGDVRRIRCGGWQQLLLEETPQGAQCRLVPLAFRASRNPSSLDFSADGRSLAIGTYGGTQDSDLLSHLMSSDSTQEYWGEEEICIWDREKGVLTHRLLGRSENVHQVLFSPDATYLAGISKERTGFPTKAGKATGYKYNKGMTARLFDLATGAAHIVGKKGALALAFSHTLPILGVCGESELSIWSLDTKKALHKEKTTMAYSHLDFSDDGKFLAVHSEDEAIVDVWQVEPWVHLRTIAIGAMTNTYSMHFLPKSSILFCSVSGSDGFFDAATGERVPCPLKLKQLSSSTRPKPDDWQEKWNGRTCLTRDAKSLVVWGEKAVSRWDLESGELLSEVTHEAFPSRYSIRQFCSEPDTDRLAILGDRYEYGIKYLAPGEAEPDQPEPAHAATMLTTQFLSDNRLLLVTHEPICSIWDPVSGNALKTLDLDVYLQKLSATHDSRYIAGFADEEFEIIEVSTGLKRTIKVGGYVSWVCQSLDGQSLAFVLDGHINVLDIPNATRKKVPVDASINTMCFVSDTLAVADAYDERTSRGIKLFDMETGKILAHTPMASPQHIFRLPDTEEVCVIASNNREIHTLSAKTLEPTQPVRTLSVEGFKLKSFSPNGRYAAGVLGHILRVFDLQDASIAMTRVGHPRFIFSTPTFSPDGRWVATGGAEGTAVVWAMP